MDGGNCEYRGWKANGFLALGLDLAVLAGFIARVAAGILRVDADLSGGGWMIGAGVAGFLAARVAMAGFMMLEPNESRVMIFSGITGAPWQEP